MMLKFLLKSRYSLFISFIIFFLSCSFIIRSILLIVSYTKADFTIINIIEIYIKGLIYDFGVSTYFCLAYSCYLLLLPQKLNSSLFNKISTYFILFMMVMISLFTFFSELTFWQEFESRFNFIAVDYLIYTYEVINNINESYPLPILIGFIIGLTILVLFIFNIFGFFSISFKSTTRFKPRLLAFSTAFVTTLFYSFFVTNSWAEKGDNRYKNELAKAGVYSFFSAFKNNELNYQEFYSLLNDDEAFKDIKTQLNIQQDNQIQAKSIHRYIKSTHAQQQPNVIMITIESFSADFMGHFGNTQNITPNLDLIADSSILFTNMYATGTRTVRGMEALTLAIPPTPGSSIVRRPNNNNLFTIGSVFENKGYQSTFFYGGDGYFDNMNQYFSGNGYDIVDRGRNLTVGDKYETHRTIITDKEVKFENAWGISDGDLYNQVIKDADLKFSRHQKFYDFVMTTSNHRPFTYPANKIDIPSGSGREGAVKYTDFAIGEFIQKIKNKPWFKNTVIIFVADHCASSAGKNEIDISKYHIPCMIYNLKSNTTKTIDQMTSQIDLYPTLFDLLGWNYESNFYGLNVLDKNYSPRIILGTYQKLAYMKSDSLVILSPQRQVETFIYNKENNEQKPAKFPKSIINHAISNYQTAYDLFKKNGLKNN
jgi:phosphoglycerol transferase MdoB-like AlkP superfamily enzyme